MNAIPFASLLLGASGLVLGLLAASLRPRRTPRKPGFLEISPRYRAFFRERGWTDPEHFLALPGDTPHIVSGHPDRHVARVSFGVNSPFALAFLKREHRVTWKVRLINALAGFGWVSRSLREARTLQALQREGIPGPEWLAAGEDSRGRAFLLVRELPGVELRAFLPRRRIQAGGGRSPRTWAGPWPNFTTPAFTTRTCTPIMSSSTRTTAPSTSSTGRAPGSGTLCRGGSACAVWPRCTPRSTTRWPHPANACSVCVRI